MTSCFRLGAGVQILRIFAGPINGLILGVVVLYLSLNMNVLFQALVSFIKQDISDLNVIEQLDGKTA